MNQRLDDLEMSDAVANANTPTLLMVIVQLTGDQRWLESPFSAPRTGRHHMSSPESPSRSRFDFCFAKYRAHANMVWTHPGIETYYRNSRGRTVVNSPYLDATYFELTGSANPEELIVEPRGVFEEEEQPWISDSQARRSS